MNPQQQHYATYNPQQQQFYARANSGNLGAYATQSGLNAPPLHAWVPPSPQEQQYYDVLFSHVDDQRRNAIGGQQAVAFFTRSHVEKTILREVWSIADVQRRSELSRNEFYVAMRLISMAQRGEQVSVQRFLQLAAMQFPLPVMEGVPPPPQGMHPPAGNGMQQQPPHQTQVQTQQQDFGSVHQQPPPASNGAAYVLTTDEKSKYDIVFQQYDTDHDGFLMGPEAVALFQMSGLDRNVLRDIWTMADVTQDSKLSVQEFYVAMHLIVCLSKRGLPMPPTLPRELGETAFGVGGAAQGMPGHDGFGSQVSGPSSQNGFPVQPQESTSAPKLEGMSAFDSLSSVDDTPLPTLDSSTPRSSQAESFNHADANTAHNLAGGFGEPSAPTPTASFQGGFPAPTGQSDFNNFSASRTPSFTSGAGRDRTNSASSLNSMSSFSGLASLPPQQPTQQLPPRNFGNNERIQMPQGEHPGFQAPPQAYPNFGAASFGTPQAAVAPERPFMGDEEEKNVVRQLDQLNEEVMQSLVSVERKQTAIEMISEKLRDLDELRHELVTLIMKREDLRSASASATGVAGNSVEELTRRAVEHSLRGLVENQKQLIHQLQCDVSSHEGELEEAVLSAKLQQKLSLESRSPLIDAASPPLSSHDSGAVGSGTNAFTGAPLSLDGSNALLSPMAAPSAPSISAFSPSPSPDATDSSGFNAFSNFDSAPRSIASATLSPANAVPSGSPFSPTPSPSQSASANDSFSTFGDFAASPSTDATPSLLADASEVPGKSPFSPTPSPAATDKPAEFDAFGAALSSSPAATTVEAPASSPFSPFSPSPSPAATDDNGFNGFSDFNTAPTSSSAASAEVPGNSSFSPAAVTSTNSDVGSASVSTDFAVPTPSPVANIDASESSLLSPAPSSAVTETPAFDAFATAPLSSDDAATPASVSGTSGNSPFSPIAADKSGSDTFGGFSAASISTDSAAASSEVAANQESTGKLLPSPAAATDSSEFSGFGAFSAAPVSTDSAAASSESVANQESTGSLLPSPAAATDKSEFNGFGDLDAPPASIGSAASAEKATGNSPFSPTAADSSDLNSFGDFNAAPADSTATSTAPEKSAASFGNSPFSPIAKDSGFEAFGDFNASTDSAATPFEPAQTADANGSSTFSAVAADNSGFVGFGDFNAASSETTKPAETSGNSPFSPVAVDNGEFEAFGDFNAAPTDSTKPETTKESLDDGFAAFGDFSAAPASDGFGDFNQPQLAISLLKRSVVRTPEEPGRGYDGMASAPEALRNAIRDGILERKRRAGYWTKRQFVLTPTHLMYFESLEAREPSNSLATMEILAVQKSSSDPQQRAFTLVLFTKKKQYRAKNTEERDAWMEALESVSGMKGTGLAPPEKKESLVTQDDPVVLEKESKGDRESSNNVQDIKDVDLRALCEQMKKSFSWQIQISKSFSSKDVAEFVKKTLPHLMTAQIQEVGQGFIDLKLIIPLKSHVFDVTDPGRFKFVEAAAPKQPKNHLNMRGPSIANLMGNDQFNARKYAEDFLRKHTPQKIDSHCKKLVAQKENTIEELKEEISANYTSFIRAADEIKTMENSVSQLKALVLECRRTMHTLKGVVLEAPPEKIMQTDFKAVDKKAEERKQSMALDEFIRNLEVYLYERNYEQFTHYMIEYKQKETQGIESATETQQAKIDELRHLLVEKMVDEFNASLQTSERMHKKENHLELLIRLGETQLATKMCLQNYSVRIALQLRHVPSYGNALNYVINFSRTFFTSLLVCYEDYEHSFRGQKSSHFISLTVWISAQLEHFASEVTFHIFPDDPSASSSRGSSAVTGMSSSSCVAIDVSEFKSVAKYVSSALRYVFYGSRQLELAGLPTAHYLAPHLARGLVSFFTSYCIAIKNTIREEIKRERWEMTSRTIRDPENKLEREIILTQSARSFYTLVQQFLRDVQRVMNPSCATSHLGEVHEVIVWEADELLARYSFEELQYLESPKLSSSLRPKHIVGILTNAAYIQDDCAARSTNILQEYLPKAALQNREFEAQSSSLWDKLVAIGVKRCAQSLMKMSFNWQDIDLSDEALPDVSGPPEAVTTSSLFAGVVVKELADTLTNSQLNKAVQACSPAAIMPTVPNGEDTGKGSEKASFAALVVGALLREMLDDEPWWQCISGKGGVARKRLGCGGVNKFLAEVSFLRDVVSPAKGVEELLVEVDTKMLAIYQQLHPGKKDVRAPTDWAQAYAKRCIGPAPTSTR
ncbi:hypothetical protein PRIC1_013524 [Phytophthora ramorum]